VIRATDSHASTSLTPPDTAAPYAVDFAVEDTSQATRDGRVVYRWTVTVTDSSFGGGVLLWSEADLHGPAAGPEPTPRAMLATLLAFVGAALDGREWERRTGLRSDNSDIFPADLLAALEAAEVNSDTLYLFEEAARADEEVTS